MKHDGGWNIIKAVFGVNVRADDRSRESISALTRLFVRYKRRMSMSMFLNGFLMLLSDVYKQVACDERVLGLD